MNYKINGLETASGRTDPLHGTDRFTQAKQKEGVQRSFTQGLLNLLQLFHPDLSYRFMPDRNREVDVAIFTTHGSKKVELKANDSDFVYCHGDPDTNTWSYEYNFTRRSADFIIGTRHTILPKSNRIPILRIPPPRELSKIDSKSPTIQSSIIKFLAICIEQELYPHHEQLLSQRTARSCMPDNNSGDEKYNPTSTFNSTLRVTLYDSQPAFDVNSDPSGGLSADSNIAKLLSSACYNPTAISPDEKKLHNATRLFIPLQLERGIGEDWSRFRLALGSDIESCGHLNPIERPSDMNERR